MRQKDLKYFGDLQSGRLNSDDSPFAVMTNEWINAQNIRTGTTDKGVTGVVESIGGNSEIPKPTDLESVVIGDQRWSLQNLSVTKYRNGDNIQYEPDPIAWSNANYGAWCWYNNDENTGIKLYNWYAVNDTRGLAPQGWWIPTQYEWQQLSDYLGGNGVSGGKLKESGTTHWSSPNYANNSSGFTALGDGYRDLSGNYSQINLAGAFWTATESDPTSAVRSIMVNNFTSLNIDSNIDKKYGFSVRAVSFNSQYITIGSIEDTENKRFVYFNYDTIRNHQASIANVSLYSLGGTTLYCDDSRILAINPGDNFTVISGTNAGTYNCISINQLNNVSFAIEVNISVSASFDITDIIYYTTEDKIVCMYTDTNIQYNVLSSSQVLGRLNFDKNSLIHSAHIANNILSFPDSTNNEPRKINIESAISANYPSFITDSHTYKFPLNFDEITLIKPPAPYAPNILKKHDFLFAENFISNQSFQFSYQYQFYDKENTVVGAYSVSSRLNSPNEANFTLTGYNYIDVNMDLKNKIPSVVKIVNLIVRYSESNYAFIVKTWDKDNIDDNTEINNHNNSISALNYKFFNNKNGEVIPESDVLRPFDNVPIYSQTHEIAKQRYFLANNIDGYNTPAETSMVLTENTFTPGVNSTKLISVRLSGQNAPQYGYSAWYVYLTYPQIGYYVLNTTEQYNYGSSTIPTLPSPPTTQTYPAGMTYKGLNINQVINNTLPSPSYHNTFNEFNVTTNDITITGITNEYYNAFPQASTYNCGIVFYDYAMRKCGVVTNKNCIVSTPSRTFSYNPSAQFPSSYAIDKFKWTLNNTNALNEIPDWAYYYAPVLTKNQNKRFFIQSFNDSNEVKYVSKDTSGNYVYSNIFSSGTIYVALNTTALTQSGLGYVYTEGDICLLTWNTGGLDYITELPVVGQDNNYILLQFNISFLGIFDISAQFIYEIYNPYKSSSQEPYYEMGEILKINNPGTINRQYSSLFGYFNADAYIVKRTYKTSSTTSVNYICNAMSPNDLFYKNWITDTGKVNVITKLGQVENNTEVVWSDTYISGTQINGSSTFRLGSQTFVSDDCGSITKLQNTSKVQDEGSVMLALCTTETNSMYLGETQILDSTGATQFFSAGTNVIGTINILKGNYGCVDPASVVQYRGNVYYLDANNGRWVQYSANGLDNISSIKMSRFWKNWCYKYMSMTKDEIEAFGNRPYVFATVDPGHDELLISIPKLSNDPPKGFLPDYPSIVYPFDILDYQGKTISYKLGTGAVVTPHWQSAYTFNPEYFCTIQNRLFSFKDGNAWEHNMDNQNEFYGVYSPSQIMFTSNILPQIPKVYDNFLSESNIIPNFVYFYNDFPYLQTSDLVDISFVQKEGIWYAQILRNKVVPTNSGDVYTGLLTAEVMRNTNMFVLAEYSPTTSPLQLRILELGVSISKGHIV